MPQIGHAPYPGMTSGRHAVERALYQEVKNHGISGGTFSANTPTRRKLELISGGITGASVTAGGKVTLDTGFYTVDWFAQGHKCKYHRSALLRDSDSAFLLMGMTALANSGSTAVATPSCGHGDLNFTVGTQFSLMHICDTARATDGLGISDTATVWTGEQSVFASLMVTRWGEAL